MCLNNIFEVIFTLQHISLCLYVIGDVRVQTFSLLKSFNRFLSSFNLIWLQNFTFSEQLNKKIMRLNLFIYIFISICELNRLQVENYIKLSSDSVLKKKKVWLFNHTFHKYFKFDIEYIKKPRGCSEPFLACLFVWRYENFD